VIFSNELLFVIENQFIFYALLRKSKVSNNHFDYSHASEIRVEKQSKKESNGTQNNKLTTLNFLPEYSDNGKVKITIV
jgi:hypothetical protein